MWEEAWRKRTTQRENMANITYIIYIISILYTCTVVHVLRTGGFVSEPTPNLKFYTLRE